jgi:hypothetical protein
MGAEASPIWAMVVSFLVLVFVVIVLIRPFKVHLKFKKPFTIKVNSLDLVNI